MIAGLWSFPLLHDAGLVVSRLQYGAERAQPFIRSFK